MKVRYPGYDVLDKWRSPSFNEQTRDVLDRRLNAVPARRFLTPEEWDLVEAVAARLLPSDRTRRARPDYSWIDEMLAEGRGEGFRHDGVPPLQEAWRKGLAGIAGEAKRRHGADFTTLADSAQDELLAALQKGDTDAALWGGLRPALFFSELLLKTMVGIDYAHPAAWNEIGFGGPASPRGYVRMGFDERDPGKRGKCAMLEAPRAAGGRAPDIFRPGGWVPMREHGEAEPVDFAIVGAGAGGATLACRLAEAGFSVVMFDAGPFWRPLEDFASDERAQQALYWTDDRITGGDDPIALGGNNSGRGVGGSTVHFSMIQLRFRPEWFKSRSKLGYGFDWPVSWEEMEPYYDEAERALAVAGPVAYPWGPPRGRYPYRPHPVNAAGEVLARGAAKLGVKWASTPLATVSAPRGHSPPCVYRGFCNFGCSTNAKQSALVVWAPRAIAAGAEVRDMAMVGRIETDPNGRASGVHYRREGRWRFQSARNVVVAGYAIETPRLLLNSACPLFPDGLANDSGLVGTHLTTHAGPGVWATFEEEIRWYKGPPNMAVTEHWNYCDEGKDFHGGYAFMSQGPLPMSWAQTLATSRGLWGEALRREMGLYNHTMGFVPVAETEPRPGNRVELADDTDQYGLRIPRVTFSYSDNDKRLQKHAVAFMSRMLEAAGGRDLWTNEDTSHLLGTCRMGDDPAASVVDGDGRSWDIPNLWICDGSLFPTTGGVNPSLTIQALALRIGDRIKALARQGEL